MRLPSVLLGLALAGPARGGEMFDFVALAEGVHAALVRPRPPTYVFANALVVAGRDAVLVVDTHQSPTAAEEVAAQVGKLTDVPVKFVVNTHWHGDHVYGNRAYRERYPGVLFLGHHSTRTDVLGPGAAYRDEELQELPGSILERQAMLESGDLSPDERERIEYSLSARSRYLEELRSLEILPPDVTFSSKVSLDLGGRKVEIHHLGRAHTRGDVVVFLPEERLLAVGDLLEDAFPYFGDSYPSRWADALDALGRFDFEAILPAHGPVLRDRELLEVERSLLRTLVSQVRESVAAGKSLEETQSGMTLEGFASFFGGGDGYRESVRAAVERTYREVRGELEP